MKSNRENHSELTDDANGTEMQLESEHGMTVFYRHVEVE
jgi:hypothetical protein